MIWEVFVVMGLATGLIHLPRWTVFIWPAVSVVLGAYTLVDGMPTDQPGLGFATGVLVALVCIVAWAIGRGVCALLFDGRGPHDPGPGAGAGVGENPFA